MIHHFYDAMKRYTSSFKTEERTPIYMGENVASNGNNTTYGANNSSLFIGTLQKVRYSLLSE